MSQEFSTELLEMFDGSMDSQIFVAINGIVYDVSSNKASYKPPKGEYCALSGKDVTRGLAKHSLNPEDFKPYGSLEGLTEKELENVKGWEEYFKAKYKVVGYMKK